MDDTRNTDDGADWIKRMGISLAVEEPSGDGGWKLVEDDKQDNAGAHVSMPAGVDASIYRQYTAAERIEVITRKGLREYYAIATTDTPTLWRRLVRCIRLRAGLAALCVGRSIAGMASQFRQQGK